MMDPASLLLVETATAVDALWVLEEALKSGSVVLAGAMLDEVALTPARRLSSRGRCRKDSMPAAHVAEDASHCRGSEPMANWSCYQCPPCL